MHTWRSIVGLVAMYGFFYAIAHLKLSNAMVFTYSSPIFIPLIAWLFLKEKMTLSHASAAVIGLIGVLFVAKPDAGIFNRVITHRTDRKLLGSHGICHCPVRLQQQNRLNASCFISAFWHTHFDDPMFWLWRPYSLKDVSFSDYSGTFGQYQSNFYVQCL